MNYYTIPPSVSLARYVRYFWVLEGSATSDAPYIHRSMADGCAELLFHYKGGFDDIIHEDLTQKSFQSGLAGPSQKFSRHRTTENFGIFGVYLYPYAVTHLFPLAAGEIANQMIDLHTLLGNEAHALNEMIFCAGNNAERIAHITSFLQSRISQSRSKPTGLFETIQYIIKTNGTARVDELAQRNFVSTRQFERKFIHFTGFNPKLFSRIIRFQHTLKSYDTEFNTLTEVAHSSGYYDQSHFIQDFKKFSGHHPNAYFRGLTESTVWRD